MAFGALFRREDGVRIIDDKFDTLCLSPSTYSSAKKIGTGTSGGYRWRNIPGCITCFQITSAMQDISFYGDDRAVTAENQWGTPASIIVNHSSGTTAPSALTLRYVGPSRLIGSKSGTYGMQLFREDGTLAVDLRDDVVQASKVITLNQDVAQTGTGTSYGNNRYTLENGSWIAVARWRQWYEEAIGAGMGCDYGIQRVSGNQWRPWVSVLSPAGTSVTGGGDFAYIFKFTL